MSPRDSALLVLLSLLWGSAFMLIDTVIDEVDPMTAVAARLIIASAVLTPVAALTRSGMIPRSAWWVVFTMAMLNNVIPFGLITTAQEHIESSLAATLIGTMPLFTLLIATGTGTERLEAQKVAGLVAGFVGAVVLIGPDLADVTSSNTIAQFAVLAASVSYAVSTVVARRYAKGAPLSLAAGQMAIAMVISAPLALAIDGAPSFDVSLQVAAALIALGVFSSALSYIVFYGLIQRISATQASLVSYLIPIVATVLGWLVLDESVGLNLIAGLGLILFGVMAVNGTLRLAFDRLRGNDAARASA